MKKEDKEEVVYLKASIEARNNIISKMNEMNAIDTKTLNGLLEENNPEIDEKFLGKYFTSSSPFLKVYIRIDKIENYYTSSGYIKLMGLYAEDYSGRIAMSSSGYVFYHDHNKDDFNEITKDEFFEAIDNLQKKLK